MLVLLRMHVRFSARKNHKIEIENNCLDFCDVRPGVSLDKGK